MKHPFYSSINALNMTNLIKDRQILNFLAIGASKLSRPLVYNQYSRCHCLLWCCTGCGSHFENPTNFKILTEPLLVQKQTIPQQKALDLSFNLAPWKWAWHYQEAVTPSRREKHILLNFTAARRVFDFLISMTSLEVNFKDTKVFRASFES